MGRHPHDQAKSPILQQLALLHLQSSREHSLCLAKVRERLPHRLQVNHYIVSVSLAKIYSFVELVISKYELMRHS